MRNVDVMEEQRSPRETACPHCGGEAKWSFLDDVETVVEVTCEDCGGFEMARAEFERLESDILELEERRE
jgi:transcription elongation factor Elf1